MVEIITFQEMFEFLKFTSYNKNILNSLITRITSININGCSSTQRYSNHAQGKQLKNVFEMSNHRQLKLSYHKILR